MKGKRNHSGFPNFILKLAKVLFFFFRDHRLLLFSCLLRAKAQGSCRVLCLVQLLIYCYRHRRGENERDLCCSIHVGSVAFYCIIPTGHRLLCSLTFYCEMWDREWLLRACSIRKSVLWSLPSFLSLSFLWFVDVLHGFQSKTPRLVGHSSLNHSIKQNTLSPHGTTSRPRSRAKDSPASTPSSPPRNSPASPPQDCPSGPPRNTSTRYRTTHCSRPR